MMDVRQVVLLRTSQVQSGLCGGRTDYCKLMCMGEQSALHGNQHIYSISDFTDIDWNSFAFQVEAEDIITGIANVVAPVALMTAACVCILLLLFVI